MKILVTGGSGYIGSHTCLELLKMNYEVAVIDNLSNSKKTSLKRVEKITKNKIDFFKVDLLDLKKLNHVFDKFTPDAVIHFAGKKAVGESVIKPIEYYKNNLGGTINLIEVMKNHNIKKIIFSSSCTVYGLPNKVPIKEDFPVSAVNPYGRTKLFIEFLLQDVSQSDPNWNIIVLRYFNPVGADQSGIIGEDPNGIPNNLFPYITQVAVGKLPILSIYGNDYPTPDGTCIRDYIHVSDLAFGHVKAIDKLRKSSGTNTYNLGTGKGYSVLEVLSTFEKVTGKNIPHRFVKRREGDVSASYSDTTKARRELGWKANKNLEDMCKDAWHFQSLNPRGYN